MDERAFLTTPAAILDLRQFLEVLREGLLHLFPRKILEALLRQLGNDHSNDRRERGKV